MKKILNLLNLQLFHQNKKLNYRNSLNKNSMLKKMFVFQMNNLKAIIIKKIFNVSFLIYLGWEKPFTLKINLKNKKSKLRKF